MRTFLALVFGLSVGIAAALVVAAREQESAQPPAVQGEAAQ